MDFDPGSSRQVSWAVGSADSAEASFDLARRTAGRSWEAERAHIELLDAGDTLDIRTGATVGRANEGGPRPLCTVGGVACPGVRGVESKEALHGVSTVSTTRIGGRPALTAVGRSHDGLPVVCPSDRRRDEGEVIEVHRRTGVLRLPGAPRVGAVQQGRAAARDPGVGFVHGGREPGLVAGRQGVEPAPAGNGREVGQGGARGNEPADHDENRDQPELAEHTLARRCR